ncbi:uncharacterized protein ACNLHF_025955 [Anomaloglossus baeobatrachus]|uniref:uncharacterized protein LOC142246604 n=1 Tax=Anomaloglossus baeobatrachus TaxID=238106 RepID=UPI003F4FEDCB
MLSAFLRELFGKTKDEKSKAKNDEEKTVNNPGLLSDDERKQAEEAKERTRRLLSDVLKKKESLLLEDLKVFGDLQLEKHYPLITTDLVVELSRELEKVTFAKNKNPSHDLSTIAYVYPGSEDRTIYLCPLFWKKDPESKSQEDTIIHEVSHFLGYKHTVQENSDRVQTSPQSMLCPQTAYSVASALTFDMDHPGSYTDGSYSCCGETSRDTACEKSRVSNYVRLVKLMHKVERLWKQIRPMQRPPAGDGTAATRDHTGPPGEELGSDTCSVKTDFSFEGFDMSDDEMDASEEQTDIVMQMVKRWITLVKSQGDLWKTQTNLLEKQKDLRIQINLLKERNLLKAQTNLLNKRTKLLEEQTKLLEARDNVLKAKANLVKALDDMLESRVNIWETQTEMLVTQFSMEVIKADVVKILSDMLETLADVLHRQYMLKCRLLLYRHWPIFWIKYWFREFK